MTLAQFAAVAARHTERIQREDYRAGVVAQLLFNANRGKARPMKAEDFFPSLKRLKPHRQSGEEMLRQLKAKHAQMEMLRDAGLLRLGD